MGGVARLVSLVNTWKVTILYFSLRGLLSSYELNNFFPCRVQVHLTMETDYKRWTRHISHSSLALSLDEIDLQSYPSDYYDGCLVDIYARLDVLLAYVVLVTIVVFNGLYDID